MTTSSDFYERDLSALEIEQRKSLTLELLGERDDNLVAVEEKRREIRALNAARKKLDVRTAGLRREIRSGKVFESRQTELPLDPDPVASGYPLARTGTELRDQLFVVLSGERIPGPKQLARWRPEYFEEVARWAQNELDAREHPERATPAPMPQPLTDLRLELRQRRRGKKKTTSAPSADGARARKKNAGRKMAAPRKEKTKS